MKKILNQEKIFFITGLKGWAILGVFIVHVSSLANPVQTDSSFVKNLISFGQYGVLVFFLISGFTIWRSLKKEGNFSLKKYWVKRILRLYPLFVLALFIGLLLTYLKVSGKIPAYAPIENYSFGVNTNYLESFLAHISGINLFDLRYRNNILGVEWIIPLELLFYTIAPLLLIIKSRKCILIVLFATLLITMFSYYGHVLNYFEVSGSLSYHWSFERYAFTFMLGIVIAEFWGDILRFVFKSYMLILVILVMIVFMMFNIELFKVVFLTMLFGLIIVISSSRGFLTRAALENRVILYIGEISYSIYLVHFIVLSLLPKMDFILMFAVGAIVTLLLSVVLHKLNEIFVEDLAKGFLEKLRH